MATKTILCLISILAIAGCASTSGSVSLSEDAKKIFRSAKTARVLCVDYDASVKTQTLVRTCDHPNFVEDATTLLGYSGLTVVDSGKPADITLLGAISMKRAVATRVGETISSQRSGDVIVYKNRVYHDTVVRTKALIQISRTGTAYKYRKNFAGDVLVERLDTADFVAFQVLDLILDVYGDKPACLFLKNGKRNALISMFNHAKEEAAKLNQTLPC